MQTRKKKSACIERFSRPVRVRDGGCPARRRQETFSRRSALGDAAAIPPGGPRVIEADADGHYRLKPEDKKKKPKRWLSPQVKQILEASGKKFDEVINLGEVEDFEDT